MALVLIVEDEETILNYLACELENFGFDVLKATNGIDALQLAIENRKKLSLILSDFIMPRMNGLELFKKTRFHKIPFIMTTGYKDDLMAKLGSASENISVLEKPVESEDLEECVKQYLS